MNHLLRIAGTFAVLLAISFSPVLAQTAVFINEIHYDNASTDEGEAIEIAGPSATDLSGWSIVLYNGSNGSEYDTQNLTQIIPDLGDGFGVVVIDYQTNGIQNGAPDGIVLYDGTSVVQFLSYEGSFTAIGGVADGMTSTDIGVSESSVPVGQSLQLGGTGANYEDFAWEAAAANTFGAFNTNQVFDGDGGGTPPPDVVINEFDADQTSTDNAEFVELYDGGTGNTDLTGLALVFFNGNGDVAYEAFDLDGQSTDADGYFVLCGDALNVANCDLEVSPATNLIQNGADAIALYQADAASFPDGAAITTDDLIDAVVYDTDDSDDLELLVLLNAGEPQINENGGGDKDNHSNQRIPNGAGGKRNTSSFAQLPPTPGAENVAPPPDVSIVINEVDADQTSTDNAEFVELFDGGAGNTDLSGLVLVFFNGSDDASYQAFDLDGQSTGAEGYFVLCGDASNVANCNLDVSPETNLIQNGADAVALYVGDGVDFPNDTPISLIDLVDAIVYDTDDGDDTGLLVLLNAGEPQVNENGNGAKDTESNSRFPNGEGGQRNTSTYTQLTPTPGAENGAVPNAGIQEIFAIQGAGFSTPFENMIVTSENNVVTALRGDGFFMQTPESRSDGDPETSDGIFVFTGSAPTVAVGDLVTVEGQVIEFFEFTEFSEGPTVTVVGSGEPVPAAVPFDAANPSPNQPQDATAFERYEGMLVSVANGLVVGPSQSFGSDPEAEAFVVASGVQTFREPGIEFPGLAGLPVWDGNPEIFELDPDKMGLPNQLLPVGSTFEASGVLGFEFGGYELWPFELTVSTSTLPQPVRAAEINEGTIASLNLFRLFDEVKDGTEETVDAAEYASRLAKFSLYIRGVLGSPNILAVQEAEKVGVLEDLAAQINTDDPSISYDAYLVEGNDVGGIDVGFLVDPSEVQVNAVTQLAADELLTFDGSLLHDRPPLLLQADFLVYGLPAYPVEVLVVHNRSLNGIDDPANGERVRQKRLEQAQSIAQIIQDRQTANPNVRLTIVGDFNAFEFTDGYVDAVGQIRGVFDPDDNLLSGPDLVDPNLTNQVLNLPEDERYSFVFRGTAQVLDHALTTVGLDPDVAGFSYGRGNAGAPLVFFDDDSTPLRASDHDGFVVFIELQRPFPGTAVLAAQNSLLIDKKSDVLSGDILVREAATGDVLGDGVELSIGRRATTPAGFTVKADDIEIIRDAVVAGDVFYNTLDNNGSITGTETSPLDLPVFDFPPFPAIIPGTDPVTVASGNTSTLEAGSYGDIVVRPAGTLILSGGLYQAQRLTVHGNAEVRFAGNGEMRIAGRLEAMQGSKIGPEESTSLSASDFVFYVAGINGEGGGLFEFPRVVSFGEVSTVKANVFAPNGTLEFAGSNEATGAFLSKEIAVGPSVDISLDSYWEVTPFLPISEIASEHDVLSTQIAAEELPESFDLGQNYPNPFNPQTVIPFSLPEAVRVRLVVYDLLGRIVETLIDRSMDAGYHAATFDANSYPSGAYLYRIEAGHFVSTQKMLLVR